jgi:hypothetical protein
MTFRRFSEFSQLNLVALLWSAAFCPALHAQALFASAPLPDAPTPLVEASASAVITASNEGVEHKFWDRQNRALLVAAAVLHGADFAVTRANLQSGGQELNPVVRMFGRSTAGLAANFIGQTAGVIALSRLFHKTNHHKPERAVAVVNIGSSAGAVTFGLTHR